MVCHWASNFSGSPTYGFARFYPGHFTLQLAKCQHTDITWKPYIFNMKKGSMKFILNATLDHLPHNSNLKKWGKSPSNWCPLPGCNMQQTTLPILEGCPVNLGYRKFWGSRVCGSYRIIYSTLLNYKPNSD